jgi:hypothetical protein
MLGYIKRSSLNIRNEKTRFALYKTMVRLVRSQLHGILNTGLVTTIGIIDTSNWKRSTPRNQIYSIITIHVGNIIQRETHKNWSVTTVVLARISWYRISVQNACFIPGSEHPNKDNLSRDQGKQWNSSNYITYSPCKYINISKQFLLQIF